MLRYIAVHVKDPTFLTLRGGSKLPTWAFRFRYHHMGLHGSGIFTWPSWFRYHVLGRKDLVTLFLGWTSSISFNSNWAARRAIRLRHLRGPPGLAGI